VGAIHYVAGLILAVALVTGFVSLIVFLKNHPDFIPWFVIGIFIFVLTLFFGVILEEMFFNDAA